MNILAHYPGQGLGPLGAESRAAAVEALAKEVRK